MRRVRTTHENVPRYRNAQDIGSGKFSIHIHDRLLFTHPSNYKQTPSLPNLEPKGQTTAKTTVKTKLFDKLFDYIKGYEVILEKLLPDVAFKFYKTFSNGTKLLFKDMNEFLWVFHVLSATSNWEIACKSMSRKQLELYLTLPAELLRVAPVLVISAFPMAQNVIFPLAMWAPKRLLSVHFWSDMTKKEVHGENLRHRQSYYRSVFKNMVGIHSMSHGLYSNSPKLKGLLLTLKGIKSGNNGNTSAAAKDQHDTYHIYKANMQKLVTGGHPNTSDILEMASYFQCKDGPLSLTKLPALHVRYLLKTHNSNHVGLTSFWFPKRKLQIYANMIMQIDRAIERENPKTMDIKDIAECCSTRGLNIDHATEDETRSYLDKWLNISSKLNSDTCSLLLHLPIFLGFNHQSRYEEDKR